MPKLHGLWSFSAASEIGSQPAHEWVLFQVPRMAGASAEDEVGIHAFDAAVVVVEIFAEVAGIAWAPQAYVLICMALDMALTKPVQAHNPSWEAPFALYAAPFEVFAFPDRCPAHPIHNFHDHDRWSRDFVLVEAAEILTWAERGMPLNEHRRTPLWPNSNREKSAPGLIYLDVRRVRCMNYRDEVLGIAWKRRSLVVMLV